ncbi:hypothetical protein F4810DRAFT_721593 [Camillea tinctor]|nr:hypothetical protein F4810DRAFT_721593 [Camillea tinctor]
MREAEEKIPIDDQSPETGLLEFEHSPSRCPSCRQVTTKARRIPPLCYTPQPQIPIEHLSPSAAPEVVTEYVKLPQSTSTPSDPYARLSPPTPENSQVGSQTTPSPTLPEPVSYLHSIERELSEIRPFTPSRDPPPEPSQPQPKRTGFCSRKWLGSKPKPSRKDSKPKSTYSQDSNGEPTLPQFLSFGFSHTGKNLLIWKKDGEALVRIEVEADGGRLLDLREMLPLSEGEGDAVDILVNLRFAAEGDEWIAAIISYNITHQRRTSLLMFHSSGLPKHSTLYPLNNYAIKPRCLAISPDNAFLAAGGPATPRFQALGFSADSSCLAVSTQIRHSMLRSDDDDSVFTRVWRCEPGSNDSMALWPCRMPTDGQGLTTITFHPHLSTALITGLTSTPYPLFLTPQDTTPPPSSYSYSSSSSPSSPDIFDFRIRAACARPPPHAHVAYLLDHRSRIFRADLRARTTRLVADLGALRGSLRPREEPAGLAVDGEVVRVFWRQGPGLWCAEVDVAASTTTAERDGKGGARMTKAKTKTNLRRIWMEAVGAC